MKGAVLFAIMFLLIAPATRNYLTGHLGSFGEWVGAWSPFSYIILAIVIAAPIYGIQLMLSWPKEVVPENPMAKYRRDSVDNE